LLGGHSASLYDDYNDLVALKDYSDQDRLSRYAQDHLGFFFPDKAINTHLDLSTSTNETVYASGHAIAMFVTVLSTILAAILLVGAIVALYLIQSPSWKLALTGLFTTMFAASVGLLTNATRGELFAATAA
jgi:hypothetical protein